MKILSKEILLFLLSKCKPFFFFFFVVNPAASTRPLFSQVWTLQNSGVNQHLFAVFFTDSLNGYAGGESGTLIKTTNGGLLWFPLSAPTNASISSIYFVHPDTGWIAGNSGMMYKTINGGQSWITQSTGTSLDISDIFFINSRNGWAVTLTANPLYLRTTDGGNLWMGAQTIGFPINSIFFLDSLQGYSSGGRFDWLGFVNSTTDGGRTWSPPQSVDLEVMFDVAFLNPFFGITIGGDHDYFGSLAYQTFNGGKTWHIQNISDTVPSPLIGLAFLDSQHAWACGYGKIYRVNPLMENWELLPDTVTKWTWYGLSFINPDIGWFSGAYGKILHYHKRSLSLGEVNPSKNRFHLQPNYPNPFNASTTIPFSVSEPAFVELSIYNLLGQPVKTLFAGNLLPGEYHCLWDGKNQNRQSVTSGVYIYLLKINHRIVSGRKMILIR